MFPNYISKLSLFFAQLYFDLKPVKVAQFVLQNSLAKTYLSKFEGHFVSVYEYCVACTRTASNPSCAPAKAGPQGVPALRLPPGGSHITQVHCVHIV